MISRETILGTLKSMLEPLDFVFGMYEGGAAAWGRVDEWSDIDLGIDIAEGRLDDAFAAVASALSSIAPIALEYDMPNPQVAAQKFYHLQGSSIFLQVDLCFEYADPAKPKDEPIERDVHGEVICHFDKISPPRYAIADRAALRASLERRLAVLPVQFELFQAMPIKELNRGHWVEAVSYYMGATLRPLVELLRIQHRPQQSTFHTRYIYDDFPIDVVKRLERLYFVADHEDLGRKRDEAEAWFHELLSKMDLDRALAANS